MHFAWTAAGVSVGLPKNQDEDGRIIYPVLRERLRPERRCALLALSPLPLIFSYKYEKSLCGTGTLSPRCTPTE